MHKVDENIQNHPAKGSGKIDKDLLVELLVKAKWTGRAVADFFAVSEGAVSQAKKRMELEVNRNIALFDGGQVLHAHLSTADQLDGIGRSAREMLELIHLVLHGLDSEDHEVRQRAFAARAKLGRLAGKKRDLLSFLVKMMGELRKQLEFHFNMQKEVYSLRQVEAFQRTVLDAIKEADPETAQRIQLKLVEVQATRSSLDFNGGSEV